MKVENLNFSTSKSDYGGTFSFHPCRDREDPLEAVFFFSPLLLNSAVLALDGSHLPSASLSFCGDMEIK